MQAPRAKKIEKIFTEFGNKRTDNYYWLNERDNPETVAYLEAENAYTRSVMEDTEDLQEKIYREIIGRMKQTDMSVPYQKNGYEYYTRFEEGKEYPVYCRKILKKNADEEIMLDGNEMAKGHDFFHLGSWAVSFDSNFIAFAVDHVSRRKYSIFIKDLRTGEILPENIRNTSGNLTWANDNRTIFYTVKDKTLRPCKIFRHKINGSAQNDILVFFEKDSAYNSFVYKTRSDKYIVIGSESTLTTEYRILDAYKSEGEFKIFQKRKRGHEYELSHQEGRWLIRSNNNAINFRLMETPENKTEQENWTEIIPARHDVLLESVSAFKDFFVLEERKNGLPLLRIFDQKQNNDHYILFDETDYFVRLKSNPEYDTTRLRYTYTSLKTPESIFDYNLIERKSEMLKREEVLGGYDPDDYKTERIFAEARDGTIIPVSIICKTGLSKDGSHPLFLYAYGSYGINMESSFRSERLSLLNRGFAYAIAHVRGGEEMGRKWYEDGKLLKKKNTFYDFIDCGKYLVKQGYTSHEKLVAAGGSAGGLLIGAVINIEPGLFRGAIAAVPFVDVITTMLDESIPLTTNEFDEWGNPNEKSYYEYMLSYSPYDQVKAKKYPNLLVTAGLHDSQVQYWEPAKWVAKMRDLKTDDNLLLLHTNLKFGHGGASGRFEFYRDKALEYAFIFKILNIRT